MNWALGHTCPWAELIAVVDVDYRVRPQWLRDTAGYFADPAVGFVQCPHAYRSYGQSSLGRWANWEYAVFFATGMVSLNEHHSGITVGTMALIAADNLLDIPAVAIATGVHWPPRPAAARPAAARPAAARPVPGRPRGTHARTPQRGNPAYRGGPPPRSPIVRSGPWNKASEIHHDRYSRQPAGRWDQAGPPAARPVTNLPSVR